MQFLSMKKGQNILKFIEKYWLTLVIILVIILFFNKIKAFISSIFDTVSGKSITPTASDAVDSMTVSNSNLTITPADAQVKADELLTAMNESSFLFFGSHDFNSIQSVFASLKTSDDFKLVIKSFGIKRYYANGLADGLVTRFLGTDMNLLGWLDQELSSDEKTTISAMFKSVGLSMFDYK